MFCGLVGEPSYIAAAEPYYEVDTTLTVVLLIGIVPKYSLSEPQIFLCWKEFLFVSTHCSLVYKGPFGDWHEERLCNATDFLKDGQLEYQEYQVDVECRRLLLEAPKWNN